VEYTSAYEVAVCNLASIALSAFAKSKDEPYDFDGLYRVTKVATRNLNKVIDRNYYPVEEARLALENTLRLTAGVIAAANLEKEAAAFAKEKSYFDSTITAITKAWTRMAVNSYK